MVVDYVHLVQLANQMVPGCGSGSPSSDWAGAAGAAIRCGPTGGCCCAPTNGSPRWTFARMWNGALEPGQRQLAAAGLP